MARPTRKQVNIKMPESLIEALKAKAEAEGDTFTDLIVHFCEQGLGMPSKKAHQQVDSNLEVIDMRIADLEARLESKVKEQVQVQMQAALGECSA